MARFGCGIEGLWRWARVLCLMALCMPGYPVQAGSPLSCGPTQLGAPCAQDGPATLALAGGSRLGVGNPVNVANGNKYQRDTDMPALPGVLGLELVRHYNSFDQRVGPWGAGWTLSYDTRLYRVGNSLQIVQADGSRVSFAQGAGTTQCSPDNPAFGSLKVLSPLPLATRSGAGTAGYVWHWRDGRTLTFDLNGRLMAISRAAGGTIRIQRGAIPGHGAYQQIVRVTDADGRSMQVHYAEHGSRVNAVSTPAGMVAYRLGSGQRLEAVVYPDGHWRGYLYEPQYQGGSGSRLTGIVAGRPDGSSARLNTWIYDAHGRVVTSTFGKPDALEGRLEIDYGPAAVRQEASRTSAWGSQLGARTVKVRDQSGASTDFHLKLEGGRHVLTDVAGAGCAGCIRPGSSTGYDQHGAAIRSGTVGIVRDELGRVVEFGQAAKTQVQWWQDSTLPARISRPSVVPGRQHVIDIEWQRPSGEEGGALAPMAITETGWRGSEPISRHMVLQWHSARSGALSLKRVTADTPVLLPAPRMAQAPGWPGFRFVQDDLGHVLQWHSAATGTEDRDFDAKNRLRARRFANGTVWHYQYDADSRLVRVQSIGHTPPPMEMPARNAPAGPLAELAWEGSRLVQVSNAFEAQKNAYGRHGHLVAREIRRPVLPASAPGDERGAQLQYVEGFERDAAGRVMTHFLPEGGALHYRWGKGRQLIGISWQDAAGRLHDVLLSEPDRAGYRHGNGVAMQAALQDGRLTAHAYLDGDTPLWAQLIRYDQTGRILREDIRQAGSPTRATPYRYDAQSRLIATAGAWYAWHADGALAARRTTGQPELPGGVAAHRQEAVALIERDASGLPVRAGDRTLTYGTNRRLVQVMQANRVLVTYRHNAFGERIVREASDGVTHFLFDAHKVVAEWRRTASGSAGVTRRYIYAHDVPVALIEYPQAQPLRMSMGASGVPGPTRFWPVLWQAARQGLPARASLYAIHCDSLGLPRLVTDERRRIRWQAAYSALGQASVAAGSIEMPLRLPGQMFDPATGWHDNYLRTYDPHSGHYLEPDPLGPAPLVAATAGLPAGVVSVTSPYGYAAQQPRRYTDPLGLVLFAFDGTREDASTATNVYQLALLYRNDTDVKAGQSDIYYQPGPGNAHSADLDAALATSADAILAAQWRSLLQHVAAFQAGGDAVAIDLLGYSRGAALARHFANQLAASTRNGRFWTWDAAQGAISACVDLRFMGLFDSVAQFGLLGSANKKYDFSIAPDWQAVAHAVALHEHRKLFPLLSTAGQDGQLPTNVLEQGFVGAHGDIGGGLVQSGAKDQSQDLHDLSDVALGWMLGHARDAGLTFDRLQAAQQEVTDPVLHDMRAQGQREAQRLNELYGDGVAWPPSDRAVVSSRDTVLAPYQDGLATYGRQERAQAEAFIQRIEGWMDSSATVVGVVDMEGYAAWLATR